MIRVVIFLIIVGALSLGVAWLADRPGDVVVTWQGLRIETSLMVLGAALLAAVVAILTVVSIVRAILRSPLVLARMLRHRRGLRAYEAISNGLIAVGAGDTPAAKKFAAQVNRIAPGEPLALLLSAQAAQLSGDRDGAERVFQAMASRDDTKALGLHGLFIEARRRDDAASARALAEEAVRTAPSLTWANRAVLEFRCAAGDWGGALALLDANKNTLDRAAYRRQRAVLLTAQALALENTDRDSAKVLALEAQKLAPNLVPAAALAARLLAEGGHLRQASRIIDKAWRANPHPELAQAYAELRYGDAARDRLKRIESLAKQAPGNIEGALAVARAAIDAQEFGQARTALAPYLDAPTKRVCLLMARLERAERNDEGRAREWTARAVNAAPDPAWTVDGYVSDHWLAASPVSGRIDAFEWRVPLSGVLGAQIVEPVIEPEPSCSDGLGGAIAEAEAPQPETAPPVKAAQAAAAQAPPPMEVKAEPKLEPEPKVAPKPNIKAEPIIPLVHAPDDPGPEGVDDSEPAPAASEDGWRKIFG
jgi:HemY protein